MDVPLDDLLTWMVLSMQTKKNARSNNQTNKKVSIEIPKVYLFSYSGRLLSSVRCDKETRDEHQTKKARALGKSENLTSGMETVGSDRGA